LKATTWSGRHVTKLLVRPMKISGVGLFNLTLSKKALILWAIAVISFSAFLFTSLSWGGSAVNGKIEGGKFYLGEGARVQQVSRAQYAMSCALNAIWPPALLLATFFWMKPNLHIFPSAKPDTKRLFRVLITFGAIITSLLTLSSLLCLFDAIF
jgi:hypothetical protein